MIFVDREKISEPVILSDPKGRGFKETNRAIKHYNGANSNKTFNFTVYRAPEVKEALITLFEGKCAYCESKFLHVYSGDVEHFRPKGEITEANPPKKPGYYWLAAEWDNLLLSCRNCNQKLKHQIHGRTGKKTMGKMNQFPLSDESKRVRSHNSPNGISDEEPHRLLLNPCIDNPEDHLEYDDQYAVIRPKKSGGVPSEKGAKSIEVYVLQRVPLVIAREKVLIQILAQIQRVKEATKNVDDHLQASHDVQFYFEKILKRELKVLRAFTNPTEEYSGMARQIVGDFLYLNFGITL